MFRNGLSVFRCDHFGSRNDRFELRNDHFGSRNDRFGLRNSRFGSRNGLFGARNGFSQRFKPPSTGELCGNRPFSAA